MRKWLILAFSPCNVLVWSFQWTSWKRALNRQGWLQSGSLHTRSLRCFPPSWLRSQKLKFWKISFVSKICLSNLAKVWLKNPVLPRILSTKSRNVEAAVFIVNVVWVQDFIRSVQRNLFSLWKSVENGLRYLENWPKHTWKSSQNNLVHKFYQVQPTTFIRKKVAVKNIRHSVFSEYQFFLDNFSL